VVLQSHATAPQSRGRPRPSLVGGLYCRAYGSCGPCGSSTSPSGSCSPSSSNDDDKVGHIAVDSSGGGHIDEEDLYRVSDGEQEPQGLFGDGQDGPDGSGDPKIDDLKESLAAQLVKQLISFQDCTSNAHNAHEHEHAQLHSQTGACSTLSDLLIAQRPSDAIPDVLTASKIIKGKSEQCKVDPALMQQLFEGRGPTLPRAEPQPPKTSACHTSQ
jgi:hypothetical protein